MSLNSGEAIYLDEILSDADKIACFCKKSSIGVRFGWFKGAIDKALDSWKSGDLESRWKRKDLTSRKSLW